MMQSMNLSPKQTAAAMTAGFMVIILLGMVAGLALVVGAFWLLVQVATLALTSIVEALTTIGATYAAADPMIRFLILVAIGFIIYKVFQRLAKARGWFK